MIIKFFKVVFIKVIDKRGLTTIIMMTNLREIEDDTFVNKFSEWHKKFSTRECGSTRFFYGHPVKYSLCCYTFKASQNIHDMGFCLFCNSKYYSHYCIKNANYTFQISFNSQKSKQFTFSGHRQYVIFEKTHSIVNYNN